MKLEVNWTYRQQFPSQVIGLRIVVYYKMFGRPFQRIVNHAGT